MNCQGQNDGLENKGVTRFFPVFRRVFVVSPFVAPGWVRNNEDVGETDVET